MSYAETLYQRQQRSFAFAERWRSPAVSEDEFLVEDAPMIGRFWDDEIDGEDEE